MPYVEMYKGKVSEWVSSKQRRQFLKDGWTMEPSKKPTPRRSPRNRIKVKEVEIIKQQELQGPEDLNKQGEN